MCHFLTIGIPQKSAGTIDLLRPHFHIEGETRQEILVVYPGKTAVFEVTFGGCSCGLFNEEASPTDTTELLAKAEEKYRRLGWSDGKIQRALHEKATALNRSTTTSDRQTALIVGIADIVAQAKHLWIFARWATGGALDVRVVGRIERSLSKFANSGGTLPENTLVSILADGPRPAGGAV